MLKIEHPSTDPDDEIEQHIKCRYVSNTEATWCLMGLEISRKEPGVVRLPVHLPNQNRRQYIQKNRQQSEVSALMHYFARPHTPPFHKMTYIKYYENYRLISANINAQPSDHAETMQYGNTP